MVAKKKMAEGKAAPSFENQKPNEASVPAADIGRLERLVHERIRLGILSSLAVNEKLSFGDLKDLLDTTDGNLSVHARKLEEAKYIVARKFFQGRMPKTEYRLTAAGKAALQRYLTHMEALIEATRRTR